ncbi:MAG: 50S ribosomal protein L25/general stress protein Ctc [Holosporales bacterium]|nr:50S ribosomal protein L25/general stress protein Ctc [Holosporales bacterium]
MRDIDILAATAKTASGTGTARALRREGFVPCVVYGGGGEPYMASIEGRVVVKHCGRADFFTRVMTLVVDGEEVPVLPKSVQYHPVTDLPLHVDFLRVSKDSEIKVKVPIEFINEDKSPAIKLGAILNIVQRYVDVLCSPLSIPEKFEIDLSGAAVGATFSVSDLNIPEGCRLHQSTGAGTVLANVVQVGHDDKASGDANE